MYVPTVSFINLLIQLGHPHAYPSFYPTQTNDISTSGPLLILFLVTSHPPPQSVLLISEGSIVWRKENWLRNQNTWILDMVLTITSCVCAFGQILCSLGSVSPSINRKTELDHLNSPASLKKKLIYDSYMLNKSNLSFKVYKSSTNFL